MIASDIFLLFVPFHPLKILISEKGNKRGLVDSIRRYHLQIECLESLIFWILKKFHRHLHPTHQNLHFLLMVAHLTL